MATLNPRSHTITAARSKVAAVDAVAIAVPTGDTDTDTDTDTDIDGGVEVDNVPETRAWAVPAKHHGGRLDVAMVANLPEFSRAYLQSMVLAGDVTLNGRVCSKQSQKVKAMDALSVTLRPTAQSLAFVAEPMDLSILFEDEHLLVLDKKAGVVVHPAAGNWSATLLNGLLAHHDGARLVPRAGIVHRLDKDTTGLMVVAKTRWVMDLLIEMIAAREVTREYWAIGMRRWSSAPELVVDKAIGRDDRNRLRMAAVDLLRQSGKPALTHFTLLGNSADSTDSAGNDTTVEACWVHCKLSTGRTHQIRVHMASLRHPLLGDVIYGGPGSEPANGGMSRQALHARHLAFEHPVTGELIDITAPPPADFAATLARLGLGYNEGEI